VCYKPLGLNLYDHEGQKTCVDAVLKTTTATDLCQPVQVRSQQKEIKLARTPQPPPSFTGERG
jgi:hypothetical protein